jgi:hypothetical protein
MNHPNDIKRQNGELAHQRTLKIAAFEQALAAAISGDDKAAEKAKVLFADEVRR